MPIAFTYVCDLLQRVDDKTVGHTAAGGQSSAAVYKEWFERRRRSIGDDGCAVLSTLLPEERPDRVYLIQVKRLQNMVARALGLGQSRLVELGRWDTPGPGRRLGRLRSRGS